MNNRIRPELRSILDELRGKIRRYVLIEGTALILVVLGLLFWLSFGVDHAWFQMSSLELPVWFRVTFDVFVIGAIIVLLFVWVLFRLLNSFRAKALALVLERRFPELNDRLVTAVELAEATKTDNELTRAMLNRTVDDVVAATQKLDVSRVFDKKPIRRAIVLAALLIASIGGLAVGSQSSLSTWADSFLYLNGEYWNRENDLTIKVIAQPGDVIREFHDQKYKHPRGADVTILIEAKQGSKVPEQVNLRYRLASGRDGGTVVCSKIGDKKFKHSFAAILENHEFTVYGGDFVTRTSYKIEVVDPPRLDKIELACNYPAYMERNKPGTADEKAGRDLVAVRAMQVAIPNETEFLLQAVSNKELTSIRIQFAVNELTLDRQSDGTISGNLVERTEDGQVVSDTPLPSDRVSNWLTGKNKKISVPFVISTQESDAAKDRIEELTTESGKPFVIAPDTQVRIYMEDIDEILTAEPARMLINGIPDSAPEIETGLRGIGTSITRRASIPVIGKIIDDFGLKNVRFSYRVDDEDWEDLDLEVTVEASQTEDEPLKSFQLQQSKASTIVNDNDNDEARSKYARFEVTPLDLSIGQKLILSVVATDRDDLNGPHETRSERYTFKVVSKEELGSVLYQRELNLRRQFEIIIDETRQIQQDLIRHSIRVDERKKLVDSGASDAESKAKIASINTAVTACSERSLHALRKNVQECASVELAFRDIREELVNNALHTPQTLSRLDDRIVKPLEQINEKDYPVADIALGKFRQRNIDQQDPSTSITYSVETLDAMIKRMEIILNEMKKLETFQEALEQLKAIIAKQEELRERLKKEQKRRLLQDLGE